MIESWNPEPARRRVLIVDDERAEHASRGSQTSRVSRSPARTSTLQIPASYLCARSVSLPDRFGSARCDSEPFAVQPGQRVTWLNELTLTRSSLLIR